jgi:hypothetical protein
MFEVAIVHVQQETAATRIIGTDSIYCEVLTEPRNKIQVNFRPLKDVPWLTRPLTTEVRV